MDLMSDWIKHLLITNKNVEDERVNMEPGIAVPTPVVDLIFLTCKYFEQPDEVRYLSVEIFDRFVRLHFIHLLKKVWNRSYSPSPDKIWASVEKTLSDQISLRMLSCIQLASKFVFQKKFVAGKDIVKYLEAEGKLFTLASINASEMRVWKTLEYRLNFPTVQTNVEALLEQIKSFQLINKTNIEEEVALFTDFIYLHNQEIFCKLYLMTTGSCYPTPNKRRMFLKTECNSMFRAAAIVALAIGFSTGNSSEDVYEIISYYSNIPSDDIKVLANIVQTIIIS